VGNHCPGPLQYVEMAGFHQSDPVVDHNKIESESESSLAQCNREKADGISCTGCGYSCDHILGGLFRHPKMRLEFEICIIFVALFMLSRPCTPSSRCGPLTSLIIMALVASCVTSPCLWSGRKELAPFPFRTKVLSGSSSGLGLFLCLRLRGAGKRHRIRDGSRMKLDHLNRLLVKPKHARTEIEEENMDFLEDPTAAEQERK
jgi:hypothetical protein